VAGINQQVGVVPQQAQLFPWKTLFQNVELPLILHGVATAERRSRVAAALASVGLAGFEAYYPHQLSGGMQKRGSIARTLVYRPDVILMDEPFGALDALTRERMQEELQAVWRASGMTVLFITHGVEEAVFLGTDVVVMSPRPGRIIERLAGPFAHEAGARGSRAVKSDPAFVALREQVLGLILEGPETAGQ
jgi:NitT/TauT family transport system ATP-binding protein